MNQITSTDNSKLFKKYNRYFTRQAIADCRTKWLYSRVRDIRNVQDIEGWENEGYFKVESWSQHDVRKAVYFADGWLDWQLFRVSMQGLTTQEKLYMLRLRYTAYVSHYVPSGMGKISRNEKCRIDNYLDALRRGGLLDHEYKVRK